MIVYRDRQEHKGCCLDNQETIEGRLRAFLKAKYGSQERAAAELGYSQPEISRWLSGNRGLDAERLAEIVAATGANGHYILTGEGDPAVAPGASEVVLAVIRGLVTDPAATIQELQSTQLDGDSPALPGHDAVRRAARLYARGSASAETRRDRRRRGTRDAG